MTLATVHPLAATQAVTAVRKLKPLLWLRLSFLTFTIILLLTLLFWWHSQSIYDQAVQTRISGSRSRLAHRIQLDMDSAVRSGRLLREQVLDQVIRTPAQFVAAARVLKDNQTAFVSISWLDASNTVIACDPPSAATQPMTIASPVSADAHDRLLPPGSADSARIVRSMAFPIVSPQHSAGASAEGVIVVTLALNEFLDPDLTADSRLPRAIRVEDGHRQPLLLIGPQNVFRNDHSAGVDTVKVLDELWTVELTPLPGWMLMSPATESVSFVLGGIVLATLAGVTVGQMARHRQRTQEITSAHLRSLEALQIVATYIGVNPRPSDEVLAQLLQAACQLLPVPKAFVARIEDGTRLRLVGSQGFVDPPMSWVTRDLADVPGMNLCAKSREPVYIPDVEASPIELNLERMRHYHMRSVLMFPLLAGKEVLGILVLGDRVPRRFSEEERRLARLWASQAAVTLANQQLALQSDQALRAQKLLNEQVQRDAEAKELLLQEMNHRVKNNMAGIVGLLSAGSPELSEEGHQWLDRAVSRISTLARAHELFTRFAEEVSLRDLIDKTLEPIRTMLPPDARLDVDGDLDLKLSTKQAVTLAMVLQELASNAIEHGITRNGVIEVHVKPVESGSLRIEVVDDNSRSHGSQNGHHTGMGLELVRGLVGREMKGTFDLRQSEGSPTVATVQFPI